nr:hypothetical protein [uncultured Sphingomonas sp.]
MALQQADHRQAVLDASSDAAAGYDDLIRALTGAHRITFFRRDWLTTATRSPVTDPERRDDAERHAEACLSGFEPGWLTRLLRREEKVRQRLAAAIPHARAQDDADHDTRLFAASDENALIAAAQRVVGLEPDAVFEALEEHSGLSDLPFCVEGIDTMLIDRRVIAVVDGLDLEDMPEESVTLLKSGKASVKALAVGKRLELHREAICSAAVRVALAYLSTLPIDEVEVLMLTDILDRGTGHITAEPVLYLRVAVQAVQALNLTRTEGGALVDRLGGHLDWNKRDGFRAINAAAFGIELPE